VFARAERTDVEPPAAVATEPPDEQEQSPRRGRAPQLVAIMVAAACVSACQSTTVAGLNVRAAPSTSSKIVARMSSAGSAVSIDCYTHGQSIYGQTMWYPHRCAAPRLRHGVLRAGRRRRRDPRLLSLKSSRLLGTVATVRGVIFDMDGVIVDTASTSGARAGAASPRQHGRAWPTTTAGRSTA
jgi:hypothetical protein